VYYVNISMTKKVYHSLCMIIASPKQPYTSDYDEVHTVLALDSLPIFDCLKNR